MPTKDKSLDVSVDTEADSNAGPGLYTIKIAGPVFELNVRVCSEDAVKFRQVRATPWVEGSLRIGESAGAPVLWSADQDGTILILIGHDDETWDIAVSVRGDTVDAIIRELEMCAKARDEA